MSNKWFVIGTLSIGLIACVYFFTRPNETTDTIKQPNSSQEMGSKATESAVVFVRPHSPRFGNAMGRVTVVEWLDPECEACRAMHIHVKKFITEYGDRVSFVIRYMPYHKGSMYAASVLEETREFGAFEKALDILMAKQPEWGSHHSPRPDLIPTYLTGLGIPPENFNRETVIAKHKEKILIDQKDGIAAGVKGTPSFFINEKPLLKLGVEQLREAIETALADKI